MTNKKRTSAEAEIDALARWALSARQRRDPGEHGRVLKAKAKARGVRTSVLVREALTRYLDVS